MTCVELMASKAKRVVTKHSHLRKKNNIPMMLVYGEPRHSVEIYIKKKKLLVPLA